MNNLPAEPNDQLVKEVYAHFGLCMYLSQVFETGLVNLLTAIETATSDTPTGETFDRFQKDHEALTFGNLVRKIAKFDLFEDKFLEEIHRAKSERNHLAHHFFREHALDFATSDGCYEMLAILKSREELFDDVQNQIFILEDEIFEKIGLSPEKIKSETIRIQNELLADARKYKR